MDLSEKYPEIFEVILGWNGIGGREFFCSIF